MSPAATTTATRSGAILIAAGGTGGHVYPGLALAAAIRDAASGVRVAFIGTDRGLERTVVPQAGYELYRIDVIPLSRRPGLSQIQTAVRFLRSVRQVRQVLRDERALVVVGMGGYTSLPACYKSTRQHISFCTSRAPCRAWRTASPPGSPGTWRWPSRAR